MEMLLVTTVKEEELVRSHHAALRRVFRRSFLLLLGLNLLLELMVFLFFETLHMGGGVWALLTVLFVGGAIVTLADFAAMRWLSVREGLRRPTPLKASGAMLGWLCGGPWLALAFALLIALKLEGPREGAVVFAVWMVTCVLYDRALIGLCRAWLKPGIRQRLSGE